MRFDSQCHAACSFSGERGCEGVHDVGAGDGGSGDASQGELRVVIEDVEGVTSACHNSLGYGAEAFQAELGRLSGWGTTKPRRVR